MKKEMKCLKCGGNCASGMIFLNGGDIICTSCIYAVLGGDNDNGHDWRFSVMTDVAQKIRDSLVLNKDS